MSLKFIVKKLNVNKFDNNFSKRLNHVNESAIVQSVLDSIIIYRKSVGESHLDSSNIGKYI
jgi:hypothetical protein